MGEGTPVMLSAAGAARATGAARSTIQRRLKAGDFPNAVETAQGWRIPVADLLRAGFQMQPEPDGQGVPARQERGQPQRAGATPDEAAVPPGDVERLRAEIEQMRQRLAVERVQREAAEAVARERERVIDVQAQALRMLTAGPSASDPVAGPERDEAGEDEVVSPVAGGVRARVRRWWRG